MNISIASHSDIDDIMSFINSEWKEGHILARDKDFFVYEHLIDNQVNFVVSRDNDKKINGVLGFIPSALDEVSDINTVIWKVSKNTDNPVLGIQLLQFLQKEKGIRTVLSVGINKKTKGIYNYLGMFTDTLEHYVMINKNITEFKIAKVSRIQDFDMMPSAPDENYEIKLLKDDNELSDFDFEKCRENITFKNRKYFNKRYFLHPIYKYEVYAAYLKDEIVGLAVTRIQSYNESKIIRIVDFIGDEKCFGSLGVFFSELIKKEGYEYADLYCFGLDRDILYKAGFFRIDHSGEDLIIPNYFAPFVQQNVPIYFFADTQKIEKLRLFKADGDQDRPN